MDVSRSARRRVILNFHGIGDPPVPVPADEERYWCPTAEWRRLVAVVAEVADEGRSVEVTFDDGNASDIDHALPALLEHRLTATFFVCAGRLGRAGYLDEDRTRQLRAAGMRIGSHGWDHVDLRRLPETDLVRETRGSQERLSEACGEPVRHFAVPLGSYDRRVLRHLRDYETVFTSDATTATGDTWLVPRFSYVRGWTGRSVGELLRSGESRRHRLRQRLSMAIKRSR